MTRMLLRRAMAAILSMLFAPMAASADSISDLFGTWNGIWSVDEKFANGAPLGTPPYPAADVKLILHAIDSSNSYGEAFVESALTGKVVSLSINGSSVAIGINYPATGSLLPQGFIVGILSNGTIVGDFDEDPFPGFVTWKGPISLATAAGPGPEKCDAAKASAVGRLGKRTLVTHAKFVTAAPENQITIELEDKLADLAAKLETSFADAETSAQSVGGTCSIFVEATVLATASAATMDQVVSRVTAGLDPANKVGRKLRSKILVLAATLVRKAYKAEAANIKDPDAEELAEKRADARDEFLDGSNNAIAKAEAKGVFYTGAELEAIVKLIDGYVDGTIDKIQ